MKILYGCANCAERKYEQWSTATVQPAQKYHRLLMHGLVQNGVEVYCYSGLPINRNITKKLFIHEKDETEKGVCYHYYKTINFPVFRQIMIMWGARFAVKKHSRKEPTVIFCDFLNRANSIGLLKGNKHKKFPIIMIVTDLPEYLFDEATAEKYNQLLSKADGYIFLTEQMNARVNRENKPYVVLEGHVDSTSSETIVDERYENSIGKKVIVYAGSIKRLYGIQNLVEGFIKANIPDTELQIFGEGDYREELTRVVEKHPNVKYMGIRSNNEIVQIEKKAALLVNPRPISPEYTQYSFPSKNMEYMVSGTPVLTTRLPGMPKEYYQYVYTIEDDSIDGIKQALIDCFSNSVEERSAKGRKAREFVLNNKSNIIQSKKIIDFIQKEVL